MKFVALIVAAGSAKRFHPVQNKIYEKMTNGLTVFENSITPFVQLGFEAILPVIREVDFDYYTMTIKDSLPSCVLNPVAGGIHRFLSVKNGLHALSQIFPEEDTVVFIHDGARPFLSKTLVQRAQTAFTASASRAVIPIFPVSQACFLLPYSLDETSVIHHPIYGWSTDILDEPERCFVRQTPQCFFLKEIDKAFYSCPLLRARDEFDVFSSYVSDVCVSFIMGESSNKKVTFYEDIFTNMRVDQ